MTKDEAIDKFIAVNEQLFEMCSEEEARQHIASLSSPELRDLAESLYRVVSIKKMIKEGKTS